MILRSGWLPPALFALLFGVSSPSLALAEAVELDPAAQRFALGAELGYGGSDQPGSTLHLGLAELALRYAFDARWSVAADLGLAVLDSVPDRGDSTVIARAANPTVLGLLRPDEVWTFGAGFALPLADVGDGASARLHRAAYNLAAGMRGLSRVWLWSPDRAAALAVARIRVQLDPEVTLEADLWPALLWRATGDATGSAVDFYAPSSAGLWLFAGPLKPGLRLSAVWLVTQPVDRLQLALEPGLRLSLTDVWFSLSYTANLDEPLAGGRGPELWAWHLAGGGSL